MYSYPEVSGKELSAIQSAGDVDRSKNMSKSADMPAILMLTFCGVVIVNLYSFSGPVYWL